MYAGHCPPGGIVQVLERSIPGQCLGCTAGHGFDGWHGQCGCGRREMLGENRPVQVLLFILRWINREPLCGSSQFVITDALCGLLLQRINPTVSYTVRKLFFLSPSDTFG